MNYKMNINEVKTNREFVWICEEKVFPSERVEIVTGIELEDERCF